MDQIKKSDRYYKSKKLALTDNAIKVLERRYLKRNQKGELLETPNDMFVRVARNIASAEKKYGKSEQEIAQIEEKFFDIMSSLAFLPNSPTLMNAGKELQQLAACFVLPVGDSMEAIFQALKETALIQKSGGGVGYSFSSIRPKNDVVLSTKGVSSGPISFMTVFNAATDTIKQGGTRRGANMGILRVDHPDILEFITAKENSEKLTNFNISVGVTESFMKAVESDSDYDILNPRTKEVVDQYRARDVFKKIVEHAWKNGDPGIVFLDRLNKDNPTPHIGQIESTNPCVTGDTLIATDKGQIKASVLHNKMTKGEDIKILFDQRALDYKMGGSLTNANFNILQSNHNASWYQGRKDAYRLVPESGYEIQATKEHKILTDKGYIELKDLRIGDVLLVQPFGAFDANKEIPLDEKSDALGGQPKGNGLHLSEYWIKESQETIGWPIDGSRLSKDQTDFTLANDDADGSIQLASSSVELLQEVQTFLTKTGIQSRILTRNDSFSKPFADQHAGKSGKSAAAKIRHHDALSISEVQSKRLFNEASGFLHNRKQPNLDDCNHGKLPEKMDRFRCLDRVKEIIPVGKQDVYDFNEPISNSFIANGIVVKNCGEQPLLPYEACNLGSINVALMVKEEAGTKTIDYDKLKEVVHVAVRFLDDVIDMSKYPLEAITQMVKNNRKIGLGVMGFADMLVLLGIPYNSEEALEVAKEVMSFIQDESKTASRNLATERGPFPNMKGSVYDSPDEAPIRNATTTTIAPTGSLSIIAGCSSGIEPIFALSFTKNVMDNDRLVEVNPYFEQIAKKEGFYSKDLMVKIAEKGNLDAIEEVPQKHRRTFITAHQISPVWHVRMQAAFQKFVDNAVSKTVNFPHHAGQKDVEDVYMLAYRLGCKGITIYRDGSRESQVLQVDKKDQEGKEGDSKAQAGTAIKPRPRPEVTRGMTKKFVIGGCGKLYVTVNSDKMGICEVFTNTGEEGCSALTEAIGRLISIGIRSGIATSSIQSQLEGIRCITCIADDKSHVLSCPDAIGKAIQFYLKGTNKFDLDIKAGPKSIRICPEEGCGGIMEPESGCYVCRNCGYSKCS